MAVVQLTTLLIFFSCLSLVPAVTVSTKYGEIEGLIISYPNASGQYKSISKFLGVPFAAPPIGELRFKAPQQPNGWKGVRQAKKHGGICWQGQLLDLFTKIFDPNFTYSEDCLYLDIYTPNVNLSLPVMVYIHGGGYEFGTAITYPGDHLALHGVVVVAIEYRLGPFGFLTTGDSVSPGNYGMLDQVEAMKWVKENIKNFGGNPDKVTIFGASSGGTSVSLHLLSPLSRELFNQAIAESGVDLSPQAFQPTSFGVRNAKELARILDCPTTDHSAMVTCLRKKEAQDILKALKSTRFEIVDPTQWGPVVDKNFLHDTPQKLRATGNFKNATFMISFNSNEGGGALGIMANMSYMGIMESVDNGVSADFFKTFLKKYAYVRHSSKKTADVVADAMEFMYTPWPDTSNRDALRRQLVDLISDYYYFAPSHKVATIHSQVAPVYMYEFAHRSKFSFTPEWIGVDHGVNAAYDFGYPLVPIWPFQDSQADKNVSLFIMAAYANFAKTGDPTVQLVSGIDWEKFNSTHRAYLQVSVNPRMESSFNPRRMSFWNDYYPKLVQLKFSTKEDVVSGVHRVTMEALAQIVCFLILIVL